MVFPCGDGVFICTYGPLEVEPHGGLRLLDHPEDGLLLFPGFQALRDAAFPLQKNTDVNCQLDYEPMITTFNEILASLPQKHTRPEPMLRAITANIGMK